jgi:hypothetical protein
MDDEVQKLQQLLNDRIQEVQNNTTAPPNQIAVVTLALYTSILAIAKALIRKGVLTNLELVDAFIEVKGNSTFNTQDWDHAKLFLDTLTAMISSLSKEPPHG